MSLQPARNPHRARRERIAVRARTIQTLIRTHQAARVSTPIEGGVPTLAQIEAVLYAADIVERYRHEEGQ